MSRMLQKLWRHLTSSVQVLVLGCLGARSHQSSLLLHSAHRGVYADSGIWDTVLLVLADRSLRTVWVHGVSLSLEFSVIERFYARLSLSRVLSFGKQGGHSLHTLELGQGLTQLGLLVVAGGGLCVALALVS